MAIGFASRRSHQKFHGPGKDDHGLSLAVDVPLGLGCFFFLHKFLPDAFESLLALLLVLRPSFIHLFEPWILLPLPQQPLGCSMETGIGSSAVHVTQFLDDQGSLAGPQLRFAKLTQAQHQGSTNGYVRLFREVSEDSVGMGPKRA